MLKFWMLACLEKDEDSVRPLKLHLLTIEKAIARSRSVNPLSCRIDLLSSKSILQSEDSLLISVSLVAISSPCFCKICQKFVNGSYKSLTQILRCGKEVLMCNATEPPPRNGSRYSLQFERLGKKFLILATALDLPPGYRNGVLRLVT